MTLRAYLTPLKDGTAERADDTVRANVSTQGLLEEGGVATERIATDNVDLVAEGRIQRGNRFSPKIAAELKSLGESTYSSLPVFDPSMSNGGPNRGYYEISNVDVSPAHPSTQAVSTYTFSLTKNGTQNSHYRAVRTNAEDIQTGLATGSGGLVGIPAAATKTQWFDVSTGTEEATPTQTVSAEFGDVDLFDPTDASTSDPTLLFELPYPKEGNVDVRVWDTRDEPKFYEFDETASTSQVGTSTVGTATVTSESDPREINQWIHAYHDGYEFDGTPIVDNGLLRLEFDEPNGQINAWRWYDSTQNWASVPLDPGTLELIDADITLIGPAEVEIYTLFRDTETGARSSAYLSVQRGNDEVVIREDKNYGTIGISTIGTASIGTLTLSNGTILDYLLPIASDQTTDPQPSQRLRARSEV